MEEKEYTTPEMEETPESGNAPIPETDPPTLVRFSRPYTFEGKTYREIDLAGIENLTARDMTAAEKHIARSGQISPIPEMTMDYVCFVASLSSEQPIEFFQGLPTKDAIKLKNRVTNFFYGEG